MYYIDVKLVAIFRGGRKKVKAVASILVFLVRRRAAEDTGRSGNVKTKAASGEGMPVSCWANPSSKKEENVESKGEREGGDEKMAKEGPRVFLWEAEMEKDRLRKERKKSSSHSPVSF